MVTTQALAILILLFLVVMIVLTVIALIVGENEKMGYIHAYEKDGRDYFYLEFYENKNPSNLLKLKNVSFEVKVDKEIKDGEDYDKE